MSRVFALLLVIALPACASFEEQCAAMYPGNPTAQANCVSFKHYAAVMAFATMAASIPPATVPPPARTVCNTLGSYVYCSSY